MSGREKGRSGRGGEIYVKTETEIVRPSHTRELMEASKQERRKEVME